MSNQFSFPIHSAFNSSGVPINGAKLNFYVTATTTRQDTFSDAALTSANANPVVSDSAGRFGAIFLKDAVYKVVLTDENDVEIWTADPVVPQTRLIGDTSPVLGAALDTGGFAINESEGSDVASAATTDIWATNGNTLHITGTTTITSFGTAARAGAWRKGIFDGVLTLTDGANLNLPGSANITTAANDFVYVYAETTTLFRVQYFRDDGKSVIENPAQATQAALEAETNENTYAPPDLIKHSPGVAKAWIMFEQVGTQSILASHNITSIADGGATGETDLVIATDFSSANYAIVGSCGPGAAGASSLIIGVADADPAAGTLSVNCRSAAQADVDTEFCSLAMFGDQ